MRARRARLLAAALLALAGLPGRAAGGAPGPREVTAPPPEPLWIPTPELEARVRRAGVVTARGYGYHGGFGGKMAKSEEGLATGFCTASAGNVCAWQNSWWLGEYAATRVRNVVDAETWAKFVEDFRGNGVFTREQYFSARICAVSTGRCVMPGFLVPDSSGDLNDPNSGDTWTEIALKSFGQKSSGQKFIFDYLVAEKKMSKAFIDGLGFNATSVGELIAKQIAEKAEGSGGWVSVPYGTCALLPLNQTSRLCTANLASQGKLALNAYMYVVPVPADALSDAWSWFGGGERGGLYVVSGFTQSLSTPDMDCNAAYSNRCSVENVQYLVSKAFRELVKCKTWLEAEYVLSRISFGTEFKLGRDIQNNPGYFYVFVGSFGDEFLAHGANPHLIGRNFNDIIDPIKFGYTGKALSQSFSRAVAAKSSAWVSYLWPPNDCSGDTNECPLIQKVSYLARVRLFGSDYYIGCGYNHELMTPRQLGHQTESLSAPLIIPSGRSIEQECVASSAVPCAAKNSELLVAHAQSSLLINGLEVIVHSINNSYFFPNNHTDYRIGSIDNSPFYLFVFSFDGPALAHGLNPNNIGKSLEVLAAPLGIDGEALHEKFKAAASNGGGYVPYLWKNPGGAALPKISYIMYGRDAVTKQDLYIGCGYNQIQRPIPESCDAVTSSFWTICGQDRVLSQVGALQTDLLAAGTLPEAINRDSTFWQTLRETTLVKRGEVGKYQYIRGGLSTYGKTEEAKEGFFTHVFRLGISGNGKYETELLASGDPYWREWTQVYRTSVEASRNSTEAGDMRGLSFKEVVDEPGIGMPTNLVSSNELEDIVLKTMEEGGGWVRLLWTPDVTARSIVVVPYWAFVSDVVTMQAHQQFKFFIVSFLREQTKIPTYDVMLGRTLPSVFAQRTEISGMCRTLGQRPPCVLKDSTDITQRVMLELASAYSSTTGLLDYVFRYEKDTNAVCQAVATQSERIGIVLARRDTTIGADSEKCNVPALKTYTLYRESLLLMVRASETEGGMLLAEPGKIFTTLFSEDIVTIFCFLFLVMVIVSISMWCAERSMNSMFPQPFLDGVDDAMWWCIVTATTVGYGDKVPLSNIGRIVGASWMLLGMSFWSFFTAVLNADVSRTVKITSLRDLREGGNPSALKDFLDAAKAEVANTLGIVLKRTCSTMHECADRLRRRDDTDAVLVPIHEAVEFNAQGGLSTDLLYVGDKLLSGSVMDLVLVVHQNDTTMQGNVETILESGPIREGELFDEFLGPAQLASGTTTTKEIGNFSGPSMLFTYLALGIFCVYTLANCVVWLIERNVRKSHDQNAAAILRFTGHLGLTGHTNSEVGKMEEEAYRRQRRQERAQRRAEREAARVDPKSTMTSAEAAAFVALQVAPSMEVTEFGASPTKQLHAANGANGNGTATGDEVLKDRRSPSKMKLEPLDGSSARSSPQDA